MARRRRSAPSRPVCEGASGALEDPFDQVWEDPTLVAELYLDAGIEVPGMVGRWKFAEAPPLIHFDAFRAAYCFKVGAMRNGRVDLHAVRDMGISDYQLRRSHYFTMHG